jgi:hypothetical protein
VNTLDNSVEFLDELVSLVQAQDRALKLFMVIVQHAGLELGAGFVDTLDSCKYRTRQVQEKVIKANAERDRAECRQENERGQ